MRDWIIILVIVGLVMNWSNIRDQLSPPPDFSAQHAEGVVLYATSWCGYCKKTREFFKAHNIAYVEYDIERSVEGKAQYEQLHGNGIPLVMIHGELVRGYNPGELKNLLDLD